MAQLLLRSLVYAFFAFYLEEVSSEHRKLIPKCPNSCFTGPRTANCFCDSKCSLIYNDCCVDAPYRSFRVNNKKLHNIHCIFVRGENKDFWMVESCKDDWSGHEHIRNKCMTPRHVLGETSDVMVNVPVTSPNEAITYKNYFCGLCNDENPEDLVEWQVKAICSSRDVTPQDVLQNLTYVENRLQWGVWKEDSDGNREFHDCYLLFQRPPGMSAGIRQCISNMVSTCPSTWRNIAIRRKCKSYVDPVTWPGGPVYRNTDCATCNNQTADGFECFVDVTKGLSAAVLNLAMPVDLSATGQWF